METLDRKRHNSAPDVDPELEQAEVEEGASGGRVGGHLLGVNTMPRTRSSSTLEELIKENAPPALDRGQGYDQVGGVRQGAGL